MSLKAVEESINQVKSAGGSEILESLLPQSQDQSLRKIFKKISARRIHIIDFILLVIVLAAAVLIILGCAVTLSCPSDSSCETVSQTSYYYTYEDCVDGSNCDCKYCSQTKYDCKYHKYYSSTCVDYQNNYAWADHDYLAMFVIGCILMAITVPIAACVYFNRITSQAYVPGQGKYSTIQGIKIDCLLATIYNLVNMFNLYRIKVNITKIEEEEFDSYASKSALNGVDFLYINFPCDINVVKVRRFQLNNFLTRTLLTEVDEVIEVIKVRSKDGLLTHYAISDIGFEINPINILGFIGLTAVVGVLVTGIAIIAIIASLKVSLDLMLLLGIERTFLFEIRANQTFTYDDRKIYVNRSFDPDSVIAAIYH
jgi:hypothetical protein